MRFLDGLERRLSGPRGGWRVTALLFTAALGLRLLFAGATADAGWSYTLFYEGDAELWQEYAHSLEAGRPFSAELGLPLRPPGMAWTIAALRAFGLRTPFQQKLAFAFLGALAIAALHRVLLRPLGERRAVWVAALAAGSHGLLVLNASLNNETPYLLLAVLSIGWTARLARGGGAFELAGFAALQAAACLLRVEHALYAAGALAWVVARAPVAGTAWGRAGRRAGRLGLAGVAFGLVLLPWQLEARAAVEAFEERGLADPPRGLPWSAAARERLEALPVFTRAPVVQFVEAAVRHRGGSRVESRDLEIVREAYGSLPEPLPRGFFVALYGPLNFHLANGPWAEGGFSLDGLRRPPPLVGSRSDYPPGAERVPETLTLVFPPHLHALNHGYLLGLTWILKHPGDALALFARKLNLAYAGATLGFGGASFPLGASGWRRPVDLVVPQDGPLVVVWRLLWLALFGLGLAANLRRTDLAPWVFFLLARVLVVVVFFGYARQGALLVPVVALYAVLGSTRIGRSIPLLRPRAWAAIALVALCGAELARFARGPQLFVDDVRVERADPLGAGAATGHALHAVRVE